MTLALREPMAYLRAVNDALRIGTDFPGSLGVAGFQLIDGVGNAPAATGNGAELASFVGTIVFEGRIAGGNWQAVQVYEAGDPTQTHTSIAQTALPALMKCDAAGLVEVRARCSAYTSGTLIAYGLPPNFG